MSRGNGGSDGLDERGHEMRVAYLITSSGMGGAERQVCHLARAFRVRDWDVAAVSMLPLERPIADLAADGIHTVSLGMRRGVPDPRAVVALRRFLRTWRPDVLHAHMVHANLLARIARPISPVPVVVSTIHNQDEGAQWRYLAYRLTDRLSDVTTAVSHVAVSESIRRRAARRGRILFVPNGLDTSAHAPDAAVRAAKRAELGLNEGTFLWLAVGRLAEAKGYFDLVRAFRAVRERHARAVLAVAGVGPLEAPIRAAIDEAGLGADARLLGLREDVPALMQAADAFVLSSWWEGLPMVLLEAAASGLPIVATDVGGSRDAIVDGESGLLTPAHNPEALAAAMTRVMDLDSQARNAMGEGGRVHAARSFSIEAVADRWQEIYLDALARRRR